MDTDHVQQNLKPATVVPAKRKASSSSISRQERSMPSNGVESSSESEIDKDVNPWEAELRPKKKKKDKLLPLDSILNGSVSEQRHKAPGQYLAIDCEMVGLGPKGSESSLARVSIVNYHGHIVLDRFVRQREAVTDYRTWVSGIRPQDLEDAPTFVQVQREVAALMTGKIVIGHALSNDTRALMLSHPRHEIRDTSTYKPLQQLAGTKRPSLKTLARLVLGIDIQAGEHSSVIDARATMAIYRSQKSAWEDYIRMRKKPTLITTTTVPLMSVDLDALAAGKHKPAASGQAVAAVAVGGRQGRSDTKTLGLSALVRGMNVQGQSQPEVTDPDPSTSAFVVREARKKAMVEQQDDLVVGFDFNPAPPRTAVKKPEPKAQASPSNKMLKKQKMVDWKNANRQGPRSAAAVQPEARPKSKDNWWEDN